MHSLLRNRYPEAKIASVPEQNAINGDNDDGGGGGGGGGGGEPEPEPEPASDEASVKKATGAFPYNR